MWYGPVWSEGGSKKAALRAKCIPTIPCSLRTRCKVLELGLKVLMGLVTSGALVVAVWSLSP